ncbi:MAG: efflux RND transporter periplasmic adaptor subunit [Bryobacteraceae bacterium]
MKRLLFILPVLLVLLAVWGIVRRSAPPEVPFTRVERRTIESTLVTNGLVEPVEFRAVRAEQPGLIESVRVRQGQQVNRGDVLAAMDAREARAALASAEARIAQAQAELSRIERGGSTVELAEIDSALRRARLDQQAAQRDLETVERLLTKQAATRTELNEAHDRVQQAAAAIQSLELKRRALIQPSDHSTAQASLRSAQVAAAMARRQIQDAVIRAPISGILYRLDVRQGSYLNPGDLVGYIGRLDELKVTIYVDEPELGRVEKDMPVTITWDALPDRQWKETVERIPTQVVAIGTRQVGEVEAIIRNPGRTLLPGTNINAEILSRVATNTLAVPKEAVRRQPGQTGVFLLKDREIHWQPVRLGISSVTHTQIIEGLQEGDAVALPTDRPLENGMEVTPVFPRESRR